MKKSSLLIVLMAIVVIVVVVLTMRTRQIPAPESDALTVASYEHEVDVTPDSPSVEVEESPPVVDEGAESLAFASILDAIGDYDRLHVLLTTPGIREEMSDKEKELRMLHFNALHNPELMGITGSPYDSTAVRYRMLTGAVYSVEDIHFIIDNTPDLWELLRIAHGISSGDNMLRDVHAARHIYDAISRMAEEQGNMSLYYYMFMPLGDAYAYPTAPSDIEKAMAYYQQGIDLFNAHSIEELGYTDNLWRIPWNYQHKGLAFCYEMMGEYDKAQEIYDVMARAIDERTEAHKKGIGKPVARWYEILNAAKKQINATPEQLEDLARQLDEAAQEYYAVVNDPSDPFLHTYYGQAQRFRSSAALLRAHTE